MFSKIAGASLALMAILVVGIAYALQQFLLPDAYQDGAGSIGFGAVVVGVALTAGLAFFASKPNENGAGGVARLSGPIFPFFYTIGAFGLWLLSPIMSTGFAKGFHLILLCGVLFLLVVWNFGASMIAAEDEQQQAAGVGRDGMLAAAKAAERRLPAGDAELKAAFAGLMDDVSYADRSGTEESSALETSIVSNLESLDFGDKTTAISAIQALQSQMAERRDLLKATK